MTARRSLLLLASLSGVAALASIYALTEPRPMDEREAAPAPAATALSPAPETAAPAPVAASAQAAPPAVEALSADAGEPIQPADTFAEFANPDDRAASLQQMQRQRFESAMDALNRRAARRAAMASAPPSAR